MTPRISPQITPMAQIPKRESLIGDGPEAAVTAE
jgi:hypothetical protein